jgi:hypothetical protein
MIALYAILLSLFLIAAVVLVHFEALAVLSAWQARARISGHMKVLAIIFGMIAAHIAETAIFAFGYWFGERGLHLGGFAGERPMGAVHFFYFSLETFTTQGVGDIYPTGYLRLLASLEPLAGLILIGWSTSFAFLVMTRDWSAKRDDRAA